MINVMSIEVCWQIKIFRKSKYIRLQFFFFILINLPFPNTIQQLLYRKLTNAHDVIILLDFTICVIQPIIPVLCLSGTSLSRSFPTFGDATMREYGWHCIPPQLSFAICSLIFKLVLFKVLLRSVSNTVTHSLIEK